MLCKLTFTRDSIYVIARICYRRSVRLSVRRVDYRKTVEVRMMKFLPYGSPLLSRGKFHPEILRGSPRAGVSNKGGWVKSAVFYL